MSAGLAVRGRMELRATPAPAERTDARVLAEFVTRVLRQSPRAGYVLSAVILNSAIAHAWAGRN